MARPIIVYHDDYLKYDFGESHVLREERLLLAEMLMENYGLIGPSEAMKVTPLPATYDDFATVHDTKYLDTLKRLSADPAGSSTEYGLGIADNPVFAGMFEASAIQIGGTLRACDAVAKGETDRAFNLGGGFHHAMPDKAAGFCLINDIAIGLKRLLTKYDLKRILYLDIDVHHADGVEKVFEGDPRVLNISLHEDGHYLFPGTGAVNDIGIGDGEGYTVNVPLPPYTGDASYLHAFKEIVLPLAESFRPEIIFTQLGADAHFADPLAHLNLTTRAYEEIGETLDDFSRQHCDGRWIGVTGGGYDIMLCPRIWTLLFSQMVGREVGNNLPAEWMEYCKITYATVPENGLLRDAATGTEETTVSRSVAKVIDSVKQKAFGYHGLI